MNDYVNHDALDLARLIADGEVSAREVMAAAIDRAERVNPSINAIVTPLFEQAMDRSDDALDHGLDHGPLEGVPFLIKDLAHLAGVPCTMGSRLFDGFVPDSDADIVTRFKAAGLNVFGKTNTPEVGLAATTESVKLGPCRNPWGTNHTSGGSSGGAAAAVAAGILPAAHATDGGGSIRIPASCCGLVGLKPTRARTPGSGWGGMSTGHVVTRTVRDSAAILDAIHGPGPGDHYHAPHFEGSYLTDSEQEPPPLRIALDLRPFTGRELHADCAAAAEGAARTCESLGHGVEEAEIPLDHAEWGGSIGAIVAANVAATVLARTQLLGRDPDLEVIERNTLAMVDYGRSISADRYVAATQRIMELSREVAGFLENYDLVLSPTLVSPPVEVGWLDPNDDPAQYGARFGGFWGFTNLYNATGQPAISLPLHRTDDGLPVGVQFAARFGEEALLLRLARQIETASPWPLLAPIG